VADKSGVKDLFRKLLPVLKLLERGIFFAPMARYWLSTCYGEAHLINYNTDSYLSKLSSEVT
jgi:hypothetical protein